MHTTKWHLPLAGEKCESSVGSVSFSPLLFSPVSHPPCPSLSRRTMHVHHAAPRQLVIITLNYRYPHVGDTQRHRCASRPRFIRRVFVSRRRMQQVGCVVLPINSMNASFFNLVFVFLKKKDCSSSKFLLFARDRERFRSPTSLL